MASQRFQSVWEAIEDTPFEASTMRLRSDLMIQLKSRIKERGWTGEKAALELGMPESRVSELMQGKIDRFDGGELSKLLARM